MEQKGITLKKVRRDDGASAPILKERNAEPREKRSKGNSLSASGETSRREAGKSLGSEMEAAGRNGTLRIPLIFARKGRNSSGGTSG